QHAEKLGINAIIILELQKVGSQSGPLNQQLVDIATQINAIPVYTGGGVRSIQDLQILKENNIEGALIATAFHKGTIKKEEIEEFLGK
ncbi:MAG: HisA/HisF-related TIM barrel protein, partial [Candidatus Heimdallarchaeota archaeon]